MELISPSFDSQANTYDQRVGLPEEICRQIAQAVSSLVVEIFPGTSLQPDDLIVEIGAGTGMISQWLVELPARYIGFDLSAKMLAVCRSRLCSTKNWTLVEADGNEQWPVANASARIIFSSRAIHHLAIDHVVNELLRVKRPDGAALILGRIQRQKHSVREQIRKQMQQQIKHHGLCGRQGEQNQRQLMALCCQRGGQEIEPVVVSQWKFTSTPQECIDNWRKKPGLAGINLPEKQKQLILDDLQIWAKSTFGRLDQQLESEEAYILQGINLSPMHK
ncbi:MAG TPA: methyltransferase domain-containing protein [Nostocaceae cyanobacterium]|nr:methyltransferase domain-containing protein [Nostocaceae cyanobacterium]